MWQNIALILVGLGILILIGWSTQVFFMASDIPAVSSVALSAASACATAAKALISPSMVPSKPISVATLAIMER